MILILGTCDRPASRNINRIDSRKRFEKFFGDILPPGTTRWMSLCGEEFPSGWKVTRGILREWSARLAGRIPHDITGCVVLGRSTYEYSQPGLLLRKIPFIHMPHTSGFCRAYNHPEQVEGHRTRLKRFLIDLSKMEEG